MRASNKILGAMLALVMTVGAVSGTPVADDVLGVETVQAATKTKSVTISNVKNGKATLYKGQRLSFKTNYKENQLKVSTSDKNVVSVKGIKITGVNKGTAKITVAVKSNTKVKKTITVKVVDRYIIRKSCEGGESDKVVEKYDRKTKKSTYTVEVKGKDLCNNVDMNIKYRFTSKDTHMAGTGYAGEMSNAGVNKDASHIGIYNVTKDDSYKQIIDFNKKSDKELYKYYELTKAEIKQTKFTRNKTDAGYVLALSMPDGKNTYVDCLIKDKETGTLYRLEYQGSEDPYTVYKSVKVIK